MPSSRKPDKEKTPDQKQKSLISFVDDKPKGVKETSEQDSLEEKVSEEFDVEDEKEILMEESQLKSIPQKLFFKGNPEPFGLKKGNIKLEKIFRESVSSKSIRYLIKKGEIIQNLERGLLLDVDYDGGQNKAYCKFYDLDSDEIRIWIDTTGHEPYCLSKEPISELKNLYYEERINEHVIQKKITEYDGFKRFEEIKRYDLINDKEIEISKVYGKTPTNIGGSGLNIKNILSKNNIKAWEADIRYHLNYIYDTQLIPGLIYKIKNGKIEKISFEEDSEESKEMANEFRNVFKDESPEIQEFSEKFLNIFLTPIPDVKRLAMDIEVNLGPEDFFIPDPQLAKQEIISVSFVSNDELKLVYVLERAGLSYRKAHKDFPVDAQIFYFKDEKELLKETFRILWEYPIVITFNGDNFDLNYMAHRADKLKIDRDLNPIHVKRGYGLLSKSDCDLRMGVHIDLFNFFFNRSISGYAFGGAYQSASLNAISAALLGRKKYEHEEEIHEMEYDILTWYNLKDSILTLELTQFNNSLVWNLIILLCRITKLPIHEMVRRQISTWIQSIFYFEHRRKHYLIPRRSEISELKKGGTLMSKFDEEKFLGAYVVPPVPGIHYNVVVMDFASLYPSIIKESNLSYETVLCPHEDDKKNLVKGTPYHICTHKMGIFAYVVGFFRDIRVKFFKPKSSDRNISSKQRSYYQTIQQALKVFINGCLPYHEEVIIRNENDEILKVKIGDLKNDWERKEILSIERNSGNFGKKKFVKIKGVIKREANEYIEIKLSDGRRIQCTKNHFIPKIEELKNIKEIEAGNLRIGDELLVSHNNSLNSNPPKRIFIPNLIPTQNLWISLERDEYKKHSYRTSEFTTNPIINLINLKFKYSKISKKYKYLWNDLKPFEKKIIECESQNYNLRFSVKYGEEAGRWNNIFLDLSINFFKLLGWYIAEGSIDKNRITITQRRKLHPIRYDHIISLIQSLNYPFSYDNKKNIRINSNILKEVIVSLCSDGAENKKIPLELLDLKRSKALLENYYLGDGNLKKGKWKRYSTKSLQLKNDLVYLLGVLGSYCSVINPKNSNGVYRIIETEGRKYRRKFIGLVDYNGTTPVRIKNMRIIKKDIDVFDIETGNGWFVTTNGIIVHNSYGVFGSQNFPLFCLPVAESTTGIGQYSIKETIKKAEDLGVEVLYGDTDSVFLAHPTKQQMKQITDWSKKELDLDLEEEKTYQFLALSQRKKNYVGIYKDTKYIDIKGLVAKKKNTPGFIKKVFNEILNILKNVTNDQEFKKARKRIIEIIKDNRNKIGNPDAFNLEDYTINISIQKDVSKYDKVIPQHVRAAIEHKKATGKKYQKGETISFVKSNDKVGAKVLELANFQDLDVSKYKELLQSALEQVLDALNIEFEEIIYKGYQKRPKKESETKKLDAFF